MRHIKLDRMLSSFVLRAGYTRRGVASKLTIHVLMMHYTDAALYLHSQLDPLLLGDLHYDGNEKIAAVIYMQIQTLNQQLQVSFQLSKFENSCSTEGNN